MNPLLQERTALITGGTRGIGFAIARSFAEAGAKALVLIGTDEGRAKAAATALHQEFGECAAFGLACDVKEATAVAAAVEQTQALLGGRLDILVNNAGITRDTLLMRMGEEEWDAVLDTNLKGAFLFLKAVSRPMLKQRFGRIINISSVVAEIGNAGQCNYASAKAGLLGLTRSAARELASRGITVNAIAPGFVETAMTQALPAATREKLLTQIPLGRIAEPREIASAALFLASPMGDYITGACLDVNGGLAMG